MPEDKIYEVTEAILTETDDGSMWRLTFSPQGSVDDGEIEVLVPPARIDNMYFATLYSHEEIMDLTRGAVP